MTNETDNFFLNFLKLAKNTEIPELFAVWSGVAAASAMLGRRVFLDMGVYSVFPNVYILLVAASGRHRKSSSMNLARDLIYALPIKPNLIPQKITTESLIDALKAGGQSVEGKIGSSSHEGFVFASEFNTFFNRKTYEGGLGSLLTDLWDCPPNWEYRTKARGVETLEFPCIGLLGASTVDWLRDAVPPEAVGGGFTSRCIFVYSETPPPPVARTTFDQEKLETRTQLVKNLEHLAALSGPAKLTEESWSFYETEYYRWHSKSDFYDHKALSGYASRRNVHWLKLAIIFAATENTLVITPVHLRASLRILEQAEVHMKIVTSQLMASEMGNSIAAVEEHMRAIKKATVQMLSYTMRNTLSNRQLKEVVDTLIEAGVLKRIVEGKVAYLIYQER